MKVVVAISGASGAIYAKQLLGALVCSSEVSHIGVVLSDNAKQVYAMEMGAPFGVASDKVVVYENHDFYAPFASGSSQWDAIVVAPCSVGLMARAASGVADSLMTRAIDVMLKERRKAIFVLRETPLNLIHIENMRLLTLSGGVIVPAAPSFYSEPMDIEQLCYTVTSRVLSLLGLPDPAAYRWGE